MAFEENRVLFGHDPTERIVAVTLEPPNAVKLFVRQSDGSTSVRQETFRPFLWADAPVELDGFTSRELSGDLPFRFLAECAEWAQIGQARSAARNSNAKYFILADPVQQFLVQSGKTLFKGLEWDGLRRLQISIDAFCSGESATPTAARASDHLTAIALSDQSGWEELLLIDATSADVSERAALERLGTIIEERDPDVIEGHDLFRATLPYIAARARRLKVKLGWGRDETPIRSRPSRLQIAEKTINYPKFEIHGRHFVDTFLLAQFYDISARQLEAYGLGDVARHFCFSCDATLPERHKQAAYVEGAEEFRAHMRQSVRQTRELASLLSGSYFVQAKIFPYSYQDVTVRGNATKIDALFLREYYRQNHSIPDLPVPRTFEGGYTDIFFTGIAKNVWHCDIASLYPSVMLQFDCFPAQDRLGSFRGLLNDLRQFRLEAKAQMREAAGSSDEAKRQDYNRLNALQSTFKILINSFYGYLGFAQAHFGDFDAASRVTEIGRDLLKKMVAWLQAEGAQVIEIDTDGIYFVPPPDRSADDLQRGLETVLPPGIEVEFDTRYRAMFSYKAKNYALLTDDGELIIKGGALKSRGLEKFQRVFLEEVIRSLLEDKSGRVSELQTEYERKIRQREWPIEFFMKTDTLQDSLSQYRKKIEMSSRNRSSAYELALKSGRAYQPGDQVSYYITGTRKNVAAYENSKLALDWDPGVRDENVEYYVAKLNDLARKFADFTPAAAVKSSDQMTLL